MSATVRLAALALLVAACPPALADPPLSDLILRPARPGAVGDKFKFTFGPAFRWSGPIHWSYNPAAPGLGFDTNTTVSALQAAMIRWTNVCGVSFVYDGTTTKVPTPPGSDAPDGTNVIGWASAGAYAADAAGVTLLYYAPSKDGGGSLVEGDIVLDNRGNIPPDFFYQEAFAVVATHELGHLLGLDHSDVTGNVMSGPPDTVYENLSTLQPDDVRGCRCLYGPAPGQNAAYTCSLPKHFDLGSVPINTPSVTQAFTVYNDGNTPLVVNGILGGGGDLQVSGDCAPDTHVAPGGHCTVNVAAAPTLAGSHTHTLTVSTSDGAYTVPAVYSGRTSGAATIDAVEFYNAGLDHYFISWVANEIAILDAGIKSHGWARTGKRFSVYPQAQPGASPICRYYIPPDKGNSHFYGRGTTECDDTGHKNPTFVNEDPTFMYMILPSGGACPANTTMPVYRVFSNRPDANHRYTTDPAVRDQMVADGWLAEGDGPDLVVMCAPL